MFAPPPKVAHNGHVDLARESNWYRKFGQVEMRPASRVCFTTSCVSYCREQSVFSSCRERGVPQLLGVHVLHRPPALGPLCTPLVAPSFLQAKSVLPPAIHSSPPCADIQPWLEEARGFEMNVDFDVSSALRGRVLDYRSLMTLMKEESAGKTTIQAVADKLLLHRMLDNLGIPQLPILHALEGERPPSALAADAERLVRAYLCGPGAVQIFLKPTHQSNGTGALLLSKPDLREVASCVAGVTAHILRFMGQRAGVHESEALQSLRPGFIAQPKYQSCVGFKAPLELRVVVLWGKARVALWWWGRLETPGEHPRRNTWFVRRHGGRLDPEDDWEILHQHTGNNFGFDRALEIFRRHIREVRSTAESIAVAFGAPFLRADFFVGDPRWGVRLNEVAYGCGCDYRNLAGDGSGLMVDDGPALAQILQEGLSQCRKRRTPDHFLSRLGAQGRTYYDMTVRSLRRPLAHCPPKLTVSLLDGEVPEDLCRTVQALRDLPRSKSFDVGPALQPLLTFRRSVSFAA